MENPHGKGSQHPSCQAAPGHVLLPFKQNDFDSVLFPSAEFPGGDNEPPRCWKPCSSEL